MLHKVDKRSFSFSVLRLFCAYCKSELHPPLRQFCAKLAPTYPKEKKVCWAPSLNTLSFPPFSTREMSRIFSFSHFLNFFNLVSFLPEMGNFLLSTSSFPPSFFAQFHASQKKRGEWKVGMKAQKTN